MQSRRGTMFLASDLKKQLAIFSVGDVVTSILTGNIDFIGNITHIDEKCAQIFVNWGAGNESQHSPEELHHCPYTSELVIKRMMKASRRGRLSELDVPSGDQFVGDPEVHGIDKPRGGGFSIMQNLQKDLAPEMMEEAEAGPKIAPQEPDDATIEAAEGRMASAALKSRRALYWGDKGRTYRMTKREQELGVPACPKCKGEMQNEKFTKNEKLVSCPSCGFKIPSSKVITERPKVEVEISPDGSVEVEVEGESVTASCRRGRFLAVEVPKNLSQMDLNEIAQLIYEDWGRKVNYAAKPYLEAMSTLRSINDNYILDSGKSIVAYFLSNATSWRGDVAKAVKAELKKRLR